MSPTTIRIPVFGRSWPIDLEIQEHMIDMCLFEETVGSQVKKQYRKFSLSCMSPKVTQGAASQFIG